MAHTWRTLIHLYRSIRALLEIGCPTKAACAKDTEVAEIFWSSTSSRSALSPSCSSLWSENVLCHWCEYYNRDMMYRRVSYLGINCRYHFLTLASHYPAIVALKRPHHPQKARCCPNEYGARVGRYLQMDDTLRYHRSR